MDAKFKGEASSSSLFPAAPGRSSRVADPAPPPARAGEEALRASGLPYTVVRPGGLTDKPAGEAQLLACEPRCTHNPLLHPPHAPPPPPLISWLPLARAVQGDRASGMVTRGDVAAVCVAALSDLAAEQVTFELVSDAKAAAAAAPLPEQLRGLFAGLQRDA